MFQDHLEHFCWIDFAFQIIRYLNCLYEYNIFIPCYHHNTQPKHAVIISLLAIIWLENWKQIPRLYLLLGYLFSDLILHDAMKRIELLTMGV